MKGYLRKDGRKGIRNIVIVAYLVECAHHVARRIVVESRNADVHLIGFPGCFPNSYAFRMMRELCTHPNVGAALLVSLGCEGFNAEALLKHVGESGRPVSLLTIQQQGGTLATVREGARIVAGMVEDIRDVPRSAVAISDLVVGTICGGSDGTSGISANPAVGRAFDALLGQDATCIFEETGELIGCENIMAERAESPFVAREIRAAVAKADAYYTCLGYGSFAPGNADGGLTTIEEKSMGAYAKSGNGTIRGVIKPGEHPESAGLYLLDVVPDGEPRFGFPNISDNAEIVELIACGCHLILFTTGRGSVVGSAIAPVIKICANPETYRRLEGDMDIDAGAIIEGLDTIDGVGREIVRLVEVVAAGALSKSEALGHQEFILTYKVFDEPVGPSCHPRAEVATPQAFAHLRT